MKIVKETISQNGNAIELFERQCDPARPTDGGNGSSGRRNIKTILIIGVVHGDEPQGKFLIENYLKNCTAPKNRMLFIPCLNPDGLDLKTRQNANEIDINRNFPTKNWAREPFASEYFGGEVAASEIETRFVMDIIKEFSPDAILTLHAPYKVVNFDGPAQELAEKISEIINYPAQSDIGYPTPGSFGTYVGVERNIPTITLELDEEIDVNELVEPMNKIFDYLANF